MKERSYAALVVVLLILLPLAYIGSYFALVEPLSAIGGPDVIVPKYRLGGRFANRVFNPLHLIDRKLRPSIWGRTT